MIEDEVVDRYVDAAADGYAAVQHDVLDELRRCSPARVAARLLPLLTDPRPRVARAVASAALVIVGEAASRSLWAVDRELRGSSPWLFSGVPPSQVSALASGPDGLGALALLSMQRNGYTRETAVSWMRSLDEPLVLRLLLLRLNDVVPQVAAAAAEAVHPWLVGSRAEALVEALPLLESMAHTVRAAHSGVAERAERVLRGSSPLVRRALQTAAHEARDEDVRRLAVLRLAEGPLDEAIPVLRRGLGDRSPRVRLAAARWIVVSDRPPDLQRALLPTMETNPSPTVRLLALRLRRRDDSADAVPALLARSFDGNAVVRFHARCQLRERGEQVDFRAIALERLATAEDRDTLVGALATLSDLGRRQDIERVRPFVTHPRSRVAAEAVRTLEILERG